MSKSGTQKRKNSKSAEQTAQINKDIVDRRRAIEEKVEQERAYDLTKEYDFDLAD